jgi:predicted lipoprotein with Yx(FWY)xxD motif
MRLSITHTAKIALVIGAAALGVVGCGSDDEESAGASAASASAGIVSVASVDGTDVLADSEGRTLYTAPVEEARILCVDACTSFWEPVVASPDEAESAAADLDLELGVVDRPEGDQQLTLDGLPLYTFAEEDAGQLEGDGFVDDFQGTHFEWQAATTSGDAGSSDSDAPGGAGSNPYDY